MTHMREKVQKKAPGGHAAACYMRGTEIDGGLAGTGDAPACRELVSSVMAERSRDCRAKKEADGPCPGDLAALSPEKSGGIAKGTIGFYAVSGFTYVVDFVRWWLELNPGVVSGRPLVDAFPRPNLVELRAAADALCAGDFALVAERTADMELRHAYTGSDNAPNRCFQVNYILVLLQEVYGFAEDGRSITFALDVDGEDLEWPLGALLHMRAQSSARGGRGEL